MHERSWYAKEETRDISRNGDKFVLEEQQGRLGWENCDTQGREANLWEVIETEAKNRQTEILLFLRQEELGVF